MCFHSWTSDLNGLNNINEPEILKVQIDSCQEGRASAHTPT